MSLTANPVHPSLYYRPSGAARVLWDCRSPEVLLSGAAGTGKAQPLDSTVWTPNGPRRMGEIGVGDVVCTPDGGTAKIIGIPFRGVAPTYRVTFSDGSIVECSDGHLWEVFWRNSQGVGMTGVRSLAELIPTLYHRKVRPTYAVPQASPVYFAERPVPIPAYTIGVLLGDGHLQRGEIGFTSMDSEIVEAVREEVSPDYKLAMSHKTGTEAKAYRIVADGWKPNRPSRAKRGYVSRCSDGRGWMARVRNPGGKTQKYIGVYPTPEWAEIAIENHDGERFSDAEKTGVGYAIEMEKLGLESARSNNKFVPDVYKYNSASVRLATLQGLMDTDGYVEANGCAVNFTSVSSRLARDVEWLVQSLGGFATITTKQPKNGQLAYTVWIRLPNFTEAFRLTRKRQRAGNAVNQPKRRWMVAVDYIGEKECQCITIDKPNGLYLTDGFIVTHNSRACLERLYHDAETYPGMRGLIVRQVRASLSETGLVTWENGVLPPRHPARGNCSREHRTAYHFRNGSVITVGGLDRPDKIMSSEYDVIYCVTGDTVVESPSDVERGFRREYSGELVTIETARGHKLTGTPNHPILTDQGWIGLGELDVGSHVVSRGLGQEEVSGANPDVKNGPSTIRNVFRSLSESGPGLSERVETVPVDFHGDGGNGEVDIVSAAGLLGFGRDAAGGKPLLQLDGEWRDFQKPLVMRDGTISELILSADLPRISRTLNGPHRPHPFAVEIGVSPLLARPSRRFGKASFPFRIGVSNVSHGLGFGTGSDAGSPGVHLCFEPSDTDPELLGDQHDPAFPAGVSLDRVVNVTRRRVSGFRHVFNLQTRDGWYFANSIVSHNCQEATELKVEGWEALLTRLRYGRMPFQQLMADCNPSAPTHWLYRRCQPGEGGTPAACRLIESRHEDNPRLWDRARGLWTAEGERYIANLDRLTGPRKQRLRYGRWVQAEGVVYEGWNAQVHLWAGEVDPRWRRYLAVDFGFTNPTVIQWWAQDPDGRLYLYREIYRTRTLVEDHAREVKRWVAADVEQALRALTAGVRREEFASEEAYRKRLAELPGEAVRLCEFAAVVCDHDAEDRRTLERHTGLRTVPAVKAVTGGIQQVAERLVVQPDGRPRLYVRAGARCHPADDDLASAGKPTCTADEFDSYIWKDGKAKDEPVKEGDHGMDACRYVVAKVDKGGTGPIAVWM